MAEPLTPNEHQQEDRASQAKALAESLEQQKGGDLKITLKGEAVEVGKNGKEHVVIANGDKTFSIKDGPSHLDADAVLKHLLSV